MTPQEVGLPKKFAEWREHQEETIQFILNSKKKFIFLSQPTGAGKSPVYVAAALRVGLKTAILTHTKALQDQLLGDFSTCRLADLRGQSSFECAVDRRLTVDDGLCHFGYKCEVKHRCGYYVQFGPALSAPLVLSNYAFWMTSNDRTSRGKDEDDPLDKDTRAFNDHTRLLVMDEGHLAHSCLLNHLSTELAIPDFHKYGFEVPRLKSNIAGWKAWAVGILSTARGQIESGSASVTAEDCKLDIGRYHQLNGLRKLVRLLERVVEIDGEWKVAQDSKVVKFEPVKPGRERINRTLFSHAEKVIITSATLRPTEAKKLALREDEFDFLDVPHTFPAKRRPFIPINGPRISYKTTDGEMLRSWVPVIDAIIRNRLDRKGIIHTISFKRRDLLIQNSEFSELMFTNPFQLPIQRVVEEFRQADPPAIFVSPSLAQGYDFPDDDCYYQIIGKVPFPSIGSDAMKARMEDDQLLLHELTMQTLVQMAGRGVRSKDDFCETFIVDAVFSDWFKKHKKLAPLWFIEAVRASKDSIPKPIPLNGLAIKTPALSGTKI